MDEIRKRLQAFADAHGLTFEDNGTVGFGRPCVGFTKGDSFVDTYANEGDESFLPPAGVTDAYHKHDCLAVLVHNDDYDAALRQLDVWTQHIEQSGLVRVDALIPAMNLATLMGGTTYALHKQG